MCLILVISFFVILALIIAVINLSIRNGQLRELIDGVIKTVANNREDFDALVYQNFEVTEKAVLKRTFFAFENEATRAEVEKVFTPKWKPKNSKPYPATGGVIKAKKPISPKQVKPR